MTNSTPIAKSIAKSTKKNVELTPRKKHEIMNRCAFYMNKDGKGGYRVVFGGIKLIQKEFKADFGIIVSRSTIKRIIQQWRKAKSEKELVDYKNKRVGACGRPSLLDEELKEAYRIIVREYAYSWRSLPERRLESNLKSIGYVLSRCAIRNHLKELNRCYKFVCLIIFDQS